MKITERKLSEQLADRMYYELLKQIIDAANKKPRKPNGR